MTEDVSAGRLYLPVEIDATDATKGLQARLDAATARVRARVALEVDARKTAAQARAAAKAASAAAVIRARVEVDARTLAADTRRALLAETRTNPIKVRAEVDAPHLRESVRQALAVLSGKPPTIKVRADVDLVDARAQLATLGGDGVTVNVDADTGGAAARIAAVRKAAERPVNMNVKVDKGNLRQAADMVLELGKVGTVAGGIFLAGQGLIQVAGGLVAVTASAASALGVLGALPAMIGGTAQTISVLVMGFSGLGEAIKAVGQAEQAGAKTSSAAAAAREAAAERVTAAQERLADAQRQVARTARDGKEAVRDARESLVEAVTQGQRRIADAEALVTERQVESRRAQLELNAERIEARRRILELKEALSDGANDEEAAAIALERARRRLADTEDFGEDTLTRRQAVLDYKQAEDALEDVRAKQQETAAAAAQAAKVGVEGDAQVIEAKNKLNAAQNDQAEAEADLQQTRADAADDASDAQERLARAQRDAAEANADAARAAASAQRDLNRALAEQTAQVNKAATARADALAGLSDPARKFVEFYVDKVKPKTDALKESIQGAILPGVQAGVKGALPLLGTLQTGLTKSAGVLGEIGERVGKGLGTEKMQADVATILDSNTEAMRIVGEVADDVVQAFVDIGVAASGEGNIIEKFATSVRDSVKHITDLIAKSRESGKLSKFFNDSYEKARLLFRIGRNLFRTLRNIGSVAGETGDDLLTTFEKVTEKWVEWTGDDTNREKMRDWFETSKETVEKLAEAFGTIVEILVKLSGDGSTLNIVVDLINLMLDGINKLLDLPGVVPVFGALAGLALLGGALATIVKRVIALKDGLEKLTKLTGLDRVFKRGKDGVEDMTKAIDDELPKDKKKKEALEKLGTAAKNAGDDASAAAGDVDKLTDAVDRSDDGTVARANPAAGGGNARKGRRTRVGAGTVAAGATLASTIGGSALGGDASSLLDLLADLASDRAENQAAAEEESDAIGEITGIVEGLAERDAEDGDDTDRRTATDDDVRKAERDAHRENRRRDRRTRRSARVSKLGGSLGKLGGGIGKLGGKAGGLLKSPTALKLGTKIGTGVGGLVGAIGGDALGGLITGNSEVGSLRATLGGTVSGAAAGAGIGATVGSVVPVVGTAVGAAVGGVIGGTVGALKGAGQWDNVKSAVVKGVKGIPGAVTKTVSKAGEVASDSFGWIKNQAGNAKDAVTGKFGEAKDAVVGKVGEMKDGAAEKGRQLVEKVREKFGEAKTAITSRFREARTYVADRLTKMRDAVSTIGEKVRATAASIFRKVTGIITAPFSAAKDFVDKLGLDKVVDKVLGAAKKAVDTGVSVIKTAWDAIKTVFSTPVKFLVDAVYNNGIRKVWNAVVSKIGLGSLQLDEITFDAGPAASTKDENTSRRGGAFSASRGAFIPGYAPGVDSVHAIVSPGEGILVPETVRGLAANLGMRAGDAIDWLNSRFSRRVSAPRTAPAGDGVMRFGLGGLVPGPIKKVGRVLGGAAKGVAGQVLDALKGLARGALAATASAALTPVRKLIESTLPEGGTTGLIRGMATTGIDKVLDWIRGRDAEDNARGIGGGGGATSGGAIHSGLDGALRWARTQAGKPYRYTGVGPDDYDCSGFMGAIQGVIQGAAPNLRRWATSSFRGGPIAGWRRGGDGAFSIGVVQGDPGHVAGTLNGVNVESRAGAGGGVLVGPAARGTNNGLFTDRFSLLGFARGGLVALGRTVTRAIGGALAGSTRAGDGPFDLLDPRGRANAALARSLATLGPQLGVAMAEGGIVRPRPGGTLARLAEAGRAEAVTDAGTLNRRLADMEGLAELAKTLAARGGAPMIGNVELNARNRRDITEGLDELTYRLRVLSLAGIPVEGATNASS